MGIEVIAFDADDTLWHNEHLYSDGKAQFQQQIAPFCDPALALSQLNDIEERNVRQYGYGIKSFTLSMVEAAIALSNGQVTGRPLQAILEIGRQMLSARLPLFDHVESTLGELSARYPLILITKGDTFEQQRKIERSGLAQYFQYIEIVADKTPVAYQRLFSQHNFDPREVLMVGNSLRSDIIPVVEIGGQAVYIHYESTWSHEHVEAAIRERYHYHEIDHLGELAALVARLNGR